MAESLSWLIPVLPLAAMLWLAGGVALGFYRGEDGEHATSRIALGAASSSLLLALWLGAAAIFAGTPGWVGFQPWLASGDLVIRFSFYLDTLALSALVLVALITLLTMRFAVHYLHREPGYQRFFIIMLLFLAAMELIVMAGDAVLTFAGWELAGVSSYLLIAWSWQRPVATVNATRAFVTNRIGDAGFLAAIGLSLWWIGSSEWPVIFAAAGRLDALTAGFIVAGFLLAAMAKSAQFPFSAWIARALEGPTPSSAVFYGSLMVHAGVYLLLRVAPLFDQAPAMQPIILLVGVLTAVYGWFAGLAQSDIKTSLMFSTTTQVGLMLVWIGAGWFTLAAWHMALHASWRAWLFLSAPALMHLATRPARPVPAWLQRSNRLFALSLQRFWLDPIANWLLVKPTLALAHDVRNFDEQVVTRFVGLPTQTTAITSLADWEDRQQDADASRAEVGRVRGAPGRIMSRLAELFHWFEERLVLKGSGEGLMRGIEHIGVYANHIEKLLSQPRYLLLLIMATFIVIL